ncbi:hypothetical protein [Methanopyrus kandleri]|uniref:Uncharacterized protein specific for M.kandleri, MK-7 family n=2 Tax=Methanopyrus kandleri TaxID=2320 RepID=Q8TWD6_METKA|nr:hypothetical protein [Methanopyrus kandleri]AAM02312.1 Uncharacterized protein specific for M.kandleri, MK-7 family [Methanopyrus kandleri AV19]HII69732.1 hypothetical protein [Methanopyrus kandleri]
MDWNDPLQPEESALEKLHVAMPKPCETLGDFEIFRRVVLSTLESCEGLAGLLKGEGIEETHPIRFLLEVLDTPSTLAEAAERLIHWTISGVSGLWEGLRGTVDPAEIVLLHFLQLRRFFVRRTPEYLEDPGLESVLEPLSVEVALMACAGGLLEREDLKEAAEYVADGVGVDERVLELLPELGVRYGSLVPRFASPTRVWVIFALLCHTCANRTVPPEELVKPLKELRPGPIDEIEYSVREALHEAVGGLGIDDEEVLRWVGSILVDSVEHALELADTLSRWEELAVKIPGAGAVIRLGEVEIQPGEYDPIWEPGPQEEVHESVVERVRELVEEEANGAVERLYELDMEEAGELVGDDALDDLLDDSIEELRKRRMR